MYEKYSEPICPIVELRLKMIFFCFVLLCVMASGSILAVSYFVDSLGDTDDSLGYTQSDGTNTLRKCIRLANMNAGSDTITFSVSGTINIGSVLPEITDSGTMIDASLRWTGTWPGGSPGVTLDGEKGGLVINGASSCVISGLFIMGSINSGISIIYGAQNNIIGGSAVGARNVISGNEDGIFIFSDSKNNQIKGNYIGTNADGKTALGNTRYGINIWEAQNNTIGGSASGEGNIISGNGVGITIDGSDNYVKGNYIGTNVDGNTALGNKGIGIVIAGNAENNIIGGTVPGERNVISGNYIGIDIGRGNNNHVKGNYIGTNFDGSVAIGNESYGVWIWNSSKNNIIGGITSGEGNVISGNGNHDVYLYGSGTDNNRAIGNYIGTNADGNAALEGKFSGIYIEGGAKSNIIGGATNGERNVISGNSRGVSISGSGTDNNQVIGNYIGINAGGNMALGNGAGIWISGGAQSNTIGGTMIGERNIISGNGDGVHIEGINTNSNQIKGNYIGTNVDGNMALGNGAGIWISGGAQSNTIGGTIIGERNIISGNDGYGVFIYGSNTNSNQVKGNYIGTNADGSSALGNAYGVYINYGAQNNIIGGTTVGEGNVISGNDGYGVFIYGSNTNNNQIKGNYIGTNAGGNTALGNRMVGVDISGGAQNNTIGGTTVGERNVISGNWENGVCISSQDTNDNYVKGNYIGTNANGNAALGNTMSGILIYYSQNNIIGGATVGERNVISGNEGDGISIFADNNYVEGNYIGLNADGNAPLGNKYSGVGIYGGAQNNIIGGTTENSGNKIAYNGKAGVLINDEYNNITNFNIISHNSIYNNMELGIDLINNGNDEIPVPIATSGLAGNNLNVTGNGAGANASVEVFRADSKISAEGMLYLGSLTADGSGNFTGIIDVTGKEVTPCDPIVLTTTHTDGNTSEFKLTSPIIDNYVVDSLGDTDDGLGYTPCDGTNTLRKCIRLANANVGVDTITFIVSGTISIGSSLLPRITDSGTVIDASSRWSGSWPGGSPGVTLSGGNTVYNGLGINGADNCIIRGLFITGFRSVGIDIYNGASNNIIGGSSIGERNVISGNTGDLYTGDGIKINGLNTNGNQVIGNYIGTNVNGTAALGNNMYGVCIDYGSQNNIIGGSTVGERNIISGNGADGVIIRVSGTNNNQVRGNYIGTDVNGTADLGNSWSGVHIEHGSYNIIGGSTAGERNVISGNDKYGIYIAGYANNNEIKGNYIGTDVNGTTALGNSVIGVDISGGVSNIIGGSTANERNVISGNGQTGVYIAGDGVNNNQVKGNYIGTDKNGTAALGNLGNGVVIFFGAQSNIIGGTAESAGNKIAYNGNSGVLVGYSSYGGSETRFNTISHNSMYDNAGLGIDLVSGGNNEIPEPAASSSLSGNNLSITDGNGAGANATVEVFKADSEASGEGMLYLGSLTADGSGNFSGIIDVTGKGVSIADAIVLNTTHTDGNTSEFCMPIIFPITLNLSSGWNMISFPGTLYNPSINSLIPQGLNIIPPLYTYDPTTFSYKEITEVKPGEGYWALSMAEEAISVNVTSVTSLVLNLKAGWNMIGGTNGNIDLSNPQDNPDGSVIPTIYTYNPTNFGYEEKTSMESGKGYWVLALQDCTLTLNSNAAPSKNNAIKDYVTRPDLIVPFQLITDKGIKEIALGVQSGASDGFDPYIDKATPPKASLVSSQPAISFIIDKSIVNRLSRDIRKNETNVTWNMEVESNGVTELKWDISSLPMGRDMVLYLSGIETGMRVQDRIKIPLGKQIITIELRDRIPLKTEVFQNYPNPFNPETWIPYQLSESGKLVANIYDANGHLVRKLDLGYKESGIYVSREKAAYWDGRNETGEKVSSGIYFYHIQTGKFSKVIKSVMLK